MAQARQRRPAQQLQSKVTVLARDDLLQGINAHCMSAHNRVKHAQARSLACLAWSNICHCMTELKACTLQAK